MPQIYKELENHQLAEDLIDALTPVDVSRQEVAFNVALVANEGLSLAGRTPTKSLLTSTDSDTIASHRTILR